jgi:hypothetical protein
VAAGEWLRELILDVGDVAEAPSRYKDDLAYWVDGREIAHFEADDVLDLRLTRAVIREHRETLKSDPRVRLRNSSDWVTVEVDPADREFVAQLVRWAVRANRRQMSSSKG